MSVLATNLCGIPLRNPIVAAAGTAGYGPEILEVVSAANFGAITTKSITPEGRDGNPPWRVSDLPAGMLNAIGLANLGIDRFMAETLPELRDLETVMIGSIAGHRIQDYHEVATAFADDAADALPIVEINVSCPNTATGRLFGDDPALLHELVSSTVPLLRGKPVLVKLSPGSADPLGLARVALDAGATGLTLCNTMPAMAVDPETRKSRIGRASGGLSGPAVHPMVVKIVHDVRVGLQESHPTTPIVGVGGVSSWKDAAEFLLVGADAVGVGTGLFIDPRAPGKVLRGLEKWVGRQGVDSIQALVGALES